MIQRRFAQIATLGFCSYIAPSAWAEVSVLVITPANETVDYSPYERRLRSELLAAGFAVSAERVSEKPTLESVAASAEHSASQSAIAITVSDDEVCGLLWIEDRSNSSGVSRAVRCCPLNENAPEVFAVRATDALSASLLELRYSHEVAPAQPARPQPPTSAKQTSGKTAVVSPQSSLTLPAPAPARSPETLYWHLQAGGAVAAWLRAFPAAYGAKLELTRDFHPGWSAGAQGFAFAPTRIEREPGSINISQFLAGVAMQYRTELGRRLSIVDGIGAGVYGISVTANAFSPYRSADALATAGYVSFEHQIELRLASSLSALASLALTAPWTRYSVIILDMTAARAAAPLLLASLGLQLNM